MTLATRCPTCGTVFRVVQDQLRVSQGWVRCGRCSQAFNALESMVEVPTVLTTDAPAQPAADTFAATDFGPTAVMEWPDADSVGETAEPPPKPAPAPLPTYRAAMKAPSTGPSALAPDDDSAYVLDDPPPLAPEAGSLLDLPLGINLIASDGALGRGLPLEPDSSERSEPTFDVVDEPADPDEVLDPSASPQPGSAERAPFFVLAQATATVQSPPAMPAPDSIDGSPAEASARAPSFLVQAERAERWRRPGVRLALSLLSLIGLLVLAGQVAHAFRDRLAATVPALRPALAQGCTLLGCRVGDFQQIESLSVESSGLARVEGAPVYRLTVTLRNRAPVEVAAPALDLSLTDAQGKPIARRVLQMSDLYLPLRTLKAGSELPIQASLGIGDRPVAGYTVEIFYP